MVHLFQQAHPKICHDCVPLAVAAALQRSYTKPRLVHGVITPQVDRDNIRLRAMEHLFKGADYIHYPCAVAMKIGLLYFYKCRYLTQLNR